MPFLIAVGVGAILMPVAARAATGLGLVDRPGDPLKVHTRPIPLAGGIAVLCAAAASLALSAGIPALAASAVGLAAAVGVVDDARSLPPLPRLVAEAAAGALLVAAGLDVPMLGALGPAGAILLAVALVNAVNLTDGQDGLAGGCVAIAAGAMATFAWLDGAVVEAAAGAALAGAAVSFLPWNAPRARMFLGDGGAYGIAVALAALALAAAERGWRPLLAAACCLAVFALELATTVLRRLKSRERLTVGDRRHVYDVLAGLLGSRGRSTVTMWAAAGLAAGGAACARVLPLPGAIAVTVAVYGIGGAAAWQVARAHARGKDDGRGAPGGGSSWQAFPIHGS